MSNSSGINKSFGIKYNPNLPPFDEYAYQKVMVVIERHFWAKGLYLNSIITVHSKEGIPLMGVVPHHITQPPVNLYLKDRF